MAKGLRQAESDPDLDVQFVFGIKKTKGLELYPVSDEGRVMEKYQPEDESQVMLVVNAVDTRTHKPVYRLVASRPESDDYLSQADVNRVLLDLLRTLPVEG